MKARTGHIMATIDMPYPPRDLISNFRGYTISEWRWFLEYSPLVLAPYEEGRLKVSCTASAGAFCLLSAMKPGSASVCSRLWPSCQCWDAPAGLLSLDCLHKHDGRWSVALQLPVLHTEELRTLWSHLRSAFLHYTTDMDNANFDSRQQEAAHQHMLAYCKLAQSYIGNTLMTWKLHSIVCR